MAYNNGGDDGTMIMVMIMISLVCCCCFCCMSSGLTAWANDGCDTSGTFNFLVGDWYKTLMGGMKLFQCGTPNPDPTVTNPTNTNPTSNTNTGSDGNDGNDGKDKKDKKDKKKDKKDKKNDKKNKTVYKDNCVYLYQDADGKKYLKTICVTRSNPKGYWENGKIHGLSSIRYGKETQVYILPRNESNTDSAIRLNDGKTKAGKLVNLGDFDDKAGAISVLHKDYKGGQLKNVGGKYDEKCVYLYANSGGKGYMDKICSKSSGPVPNTNGRLRQLSSLRVGKNAEALLTKTNSTGGSTRLSVNGQGANKVVNLSSAFNDQVNKIVVFRR